VSKGRVLLVDSDPAVRSSLRGILEVDGYLAAEAPTLRAGLESFHLARPDAMVLAARLEDGAALELISHVKAVDAMIPCIVLARREELDLAAEAIQTGAEQFLVKPIQLPTFLLVLDRVLENQRNRRKQLREEARRSREHVDPFAGSSAAIRRLAERAQRVAGSELTVLIHGETGSGKGVLAGWIHRNGPRSAECFLDLNCAGLSPEFLESELFGHEKGAFTSAIAAKMGLLEVAHRGTLFLDEIADVPLTVQPKLLKVLEEKKFRRLGDVRERQVDVRLIAASHQDLGHLVHAKRFREDLYFRINTVVLEIPPLRDRPEDLHPLADIFLEAIAAELPRPPLHLSPAALRKLEAYSWPGNIRELKNVLEHAALLCPGDEIGPDDFIFQRRRTTEITALPVTTDLLETEKLMIRRALESERGRVARAAEALGISRSSLYEKIRRYGIVVSKN
jgi:DNA-binding NtrC family response regulator